jgi:polar amino acid transport system substrate-binding protein
MVRNWSIRLVTSFVLIVTSMLIISSASTAATKSPKGTYAPARALLPASLRASGHLRIATSFQWAPFNYLSSSGKQLGIDVDLQSAIAKEFGLKPMFTGLTFPSIVPGVASGRFSMGADELNVTAARMEQVTFVDYYVSGLALLALKSTTGLSATNLCGASVGLTTGSYQVGIADKISQQCVAAGKPAITEVMFPDSATTMLGVADGRAQVFMTDNAVGLYTTQSNPNLVVLPGIIPGTTAKAGIIVAKGNTKLIRAVQVALNHLIANGQYAKILQKYGVGADNMVTKATIN